MFGTIQTRRFARAALALSLAFGAAACSDSTGVEHADAEGLEIVDAATNQVIVRVNAQRQVTGGLSVAAGGERAIEIHFLDDDGDRMALDSDETLTWTIANPAIAALGEHGGHHDLEGLQAGSTTVEFQITHGGHFDYQSPLIPITVTP